MKFNTPIYPPSLKKGDTIRIICPSRSIDIEEILCIKKWLTTKGFCVEYGENVGKTCGQFSGDDNQRTCELQRAINDPNVRAVWCARGGYGTTRIIDNVDFSPLLIDPKWIIGFSDITAIHVALFKLGIVSLHAPMPVNFNNRKMTMSAFNLTLSYLQGNFSPIKWETSLLNKEGISQGLLFGGNLSVLYSLRGTSFDIDTSQIIYFIEDVDEYLYHIDRMCNNFKMGNKFLKIKALLSGQFSKMKYNIIPFGKNAEEIISQYIPNNIVQAYNSPFGHIDFNLPLLNGAHAILDVNNSMVTLSYYGTT